MKKGEKGRRKKKCLAKEIVVNVSACEKRENCFPLSLSCSPQKKVNRLRSLMSSEGSCVIKLWDTSQLKKTTTFVCWKDYNQVKFVYNFFNCQIDQSEEISYGVKITKHSTNNNNIPTLKVIKKNFTSHDIIFFFTNICVCVCAVVPSRNMRLFFKCKKSLLCFLNGAIDPPSLDDNCLTPNCILLLCLPACSYVVRLNRLKVRLKVHRNVVGDSAAAVVALLWARRKKNHTFASWIKNWEKQAITTTIFYRDDVWS